jgi:Flp pilus assembly protein TadG
MRCRDQKAKVKGMNCLKKKRLLPFLAREDGVVGVEFVILFPLLALIVVGLVEFGHLWYVRQTLTNASREGARAAVVFEVANPDRAAWATTVATNAVNQYLADTKFPGTWNTDVTAGAATGDPVTVTVTSPSGLILLDKLLPAFNSITIAAETTMRLE